VLSMAIGFSNVFYVAGGVYLLGMVFMKTPRGRPLPSEQATVVSVPE
jgi:hypothetical protein